MRKLALTATIVTALMAGVAANAQNSGGQNSGGLVAPELSKPTPGHLLNQDYLTPTGETVPRPGVSQAPGPSPLDRSMQKQDNRIDKSICSNC
ncbi:MAG: hypothetical protein ACLPSF_03160 [Methylocella sp.]